MRASTLGILAFVALTLSACASAPPTIVTPQGRMYWSANEAANGVQRVQAVAITLDSVGVIPDAPVRLAVQAISEGVDVLEAAPDGWKAIVSTLLAKVATILQATDHPQIAQAVGLATAIINARDLPPANVDDATMRLVFASTLAHIRADGRAWLQAHPGM